MMIPFNPNENDLKISRKCIQSFDESKQFNFNDLKNNSLECSESADIVKRQWIGMSDLCGEIIILSCSVEEYQFVEIKEGLQRFLDWFRDMIQGLSKEFLKSNPEFDFVEASEKRNNDFVKWIQENLDEKAINAINQTLEVFKTLNYYANDRDIFKGNPVKPLIDDILNFQVHRNFSLRSVIESMRLGFIEGD